jgi:hypothetical protein
LELVGRSVIIGRLFIGVGWLVGRSVGYYWETVHWSWLVGRLVSQILLGDCSLELVGCSVGQSDIIGRLFIGVGWLFGRSVGYYWETVHLTYDSPYPV